MVFPWFIIAVEGVWNEAAIAIAKCPVCRKGCVAFVGELERGVFRRSGEREIGEVGQRDGMHGKVLGEGKCIGTAFRTGGYDVRLEGSDLVDDESFCGEWSIVDALNVEGGGLAVRTEVLKVDGKGVATNAGIGGEVGGGGEVDGEFVFGQIRTGIAIGAGCYN